MIILNATTKSLQFSLSAAVTTNQLPFVASYIDTTATTTTPGSQDGVSNSTTAVTLVAAPAASTQRLVKSLVIQNADTAQATVTVTYNDNATLRKFMVVTLAAGDQLTYEDGYGWACLNSSGSIKSTGGGAGGVTSVSNSDGTLTISPTTGAVVASLGPFVKASGNPASGAQFDASASPLIDVGSGSSAAITPAGAPQYYIVFIAEVLNTGQTGMYIVANSSTIVLVDQAGSDWVASTTTPASGKFSIAWNGTEVAVYNNFGSSCDFAVTLIRIR